MSVLTNNLELLILSLLDSKEMYGYQITQELLELTNQEIKEISVYTIVRRLLTKKLVNEKWGSQSDGGRRKYYYLNESGKAYFVNKKEDYIKSNTIILKIIGEKND
jgi:PadR family transcriptional regulator PadR